MKLKRLFLDYLRHFAVVSLLLFAFSWVMSACSKDDPIHDKRIAAQLNPVVSAKLVNDIDFSKVVLLEDDPDTEANTRTGAIPKENRGYVLIQLRENCPGVKLAIKDTAFVSSQTSPFRITKAMKPRYSSIVRTDIVYARMVDRTKKTIIAQWDVNAKVSYQQNNGYGITGKIAGMYLPYLFTENEEMTLLQVGSRLYYNQPMTLSCPQ